MKTILYCFSATGNSLATAKDISTKLSGEIEIRFVAAYEKDRNKEIDADRIGFIFPVYAWGMPEIVRRCVESLSISSGSYLFAVVTCGGTPGGTVGQLNRLLRKKGLNLSAGFTVRHESGKLGMETGLITFVRNLAGKNCENWSNRIDEICSIIENREKSHLEQNNVQTRVIGNFFASMASKMFSSLDKTFSVNDTCNGCGTCKNICPVDNITIQNGKPAWNHRCQQCLACVNWCPKTAIEIGEASRGKSRYHNQHVTLNELYKWKEQGPGVG